MILHSFRLTFASRLVFGFVNFPFGILLMLFETATPESLLLMLEFSAQIAFGSVFIWLLVDIAAICVVVCTVGLFDLRLFMSLGGIGFEPMTRKLFGMAFCLLACCLILCSDLLNKQQNSITIFHFQMKLFPNTYLWTTQKIRA